MLAREWKSPVALDGEEPERETDSRACKRRGRRWKLQQVADDHDARSRESRDGIEIGTQDRRDLGDKQVSGYATADASEHAEHRCG